MLEKLFLRINYMEKNKNKKKTLTISGSFSKGPTSFSKNKSEKKSFFPQKKKSFKPSFKSGKPWPSQPAGKGKTNNRNFNRKYVEQQATKRFIGSDQKAADKDKAKDKNFAKNREFNQRRQSKLTISRAMNVEEFEIKQRSLASVKRARLKEKQDDKQDIKKEFKKVIREVKIPEQITIQELSNRMAEQSTNIIKFLLNMKVMETINHTIDKDTD